MDEENKENNSGMGMVDTYRCFEALPGGFADVVPFVHETRAVLQEHSGAMVTVCGQRAS